MYNYSDPMRIRGITLMDNKVLLFTPMYNCEKQIIRVLGQITDELREFINEWIIINNRSTDNGEQSVIDFLSSHDMPIKVTLLRNDENYGLGGSHKVAFDYAMRYGFEYIIVLHGDDQGSISNILPYLINKDYLEYDCFLGARFMKGSKLHGYSKIRTFGNKVFNILFSMGCKQRIYDLGSGLNMYSTSIFKNGYYLKFKDNLVFNYCMILGSAYYKHRLKFFPIEWREDDQISNVKMASQAFTVLKLLCMFVFRKSKFIEKDHRDRIISSYDAQVIYKNR